MTRILNMKKLLFFIFWIVFIVYFLTSEGSTAYNYFTRLAFAFLHGSYYITQNPPWLNELISLGTSKFTFAYPPAPSILLIPFVALFGQDFPQQIFAQLVGSGIVITSIIICWEKTKNINKTLWFGTLVAFGNILWFLSSVGSAWYLGQTVAVLFTLIAILTLILNKNPFLTGVFFGIAVLSRVEMLIILPFFIFLIPKSGWKFILSTLGFLILFGFYNYIRFGSFFQIGYTLVPGVLNEPWYSFGIISPYYILRNLSVMFASFPVFTKSFPFIIPSQSGLSIWITSPVFVYAIFADFRKKINKLALLSIVSILLIVFMHGETGSTQFGYRFAADAYPFIFLLIIDYVSARNLRWHHFLLLGLSIFVNLWGVFFINKLGLFAP